METWKIASVVLVCAVVVAPIVVYTVGPHAAQKISEFVQRRKQIRAQVKKERERVQSFERARQNGAEL